MGLAARAGQYNFHQFLYQHENQNGCGFEVPLYGQTAVDGAWESQNLLVETGEVRFSGTPDSGLINVQAIRNPTTIDDDVKAGIKVYGPIQKPKVSVFSEPELDGGDSSVGA